MKSKKINHIALSVLTALLLCVSWSVVGFTNSQTETQGLSFKAKVGKESYVLGEPIQVEFVFSNEGSTPLAIFGGGVETGALKVFIASSQDGEYKEYFASGWGRKHGVEISIEPKQSYKYQATILWNGKPNVSHLNENAAREVLKGKITTEYALPAPGVYFIKGVSYVSENAKKIESEPAQIVINEPVGDDLKVWNRIKGNREIAQLLQKDSFDTGKDEEKIKLIEEVEEIIQKHPNSLYSDYLKPSLEKSKIHEKKRNEFYKNLSTPQKPQ
jgi:hypothetical protein